MQADRWGGSVWSPWKSHPFIYVNNNPMVFVDPYGLWSWSAFGTGFLKGAGAGFAYGFASGSISAVAQIVAKAVPGFGSVILAYQIFNTAKSVYGLSQMASQLSQIKMSDKQQSELVGNIVGGVVGSVIGGKAGKKLVNKYKSQIESAIRNYVPDKYLKGGNLDANTGSVSTNGYPGSDPTQAPEGYEWRGRPGTKPGSKQGNWFNKDTGESLRPDLDHPDPVGPHWDYRDPDGKWWRIFPDGSKELK